LQNPLGEQKTGFLVAECRCFRLKFPPFVPHADQRVLGLLEAQAIRERALQVGLDGVERRRDGRARRNELEVTATVDRSKASELVTQEAPRRQVKRPRQASDPVGAKVVHGLTGHEHAGQIRTQA
jgi:hypothetical protein